MLLTAVPSLAATGAQGRVAWRGELVPGVKISAYRTVEDLVADRPVAVSEPTALDGTWRLDLPAGRYIMVARSFDGRPKPGDYFCYYSGSPVEVVEGHRTNVGFNLIRVPEEKPPRTGRFSGIEGEITFQGQLLERVYLYVYRDARSGFKGPAYNILPVEKGRFRLRLPPGDYFLMARKRQAGGRYGPVAIGDWFNYYYGNPVHIEPGTVRHVHLETITRLSNLEQGEDEIPFHGVRGRIFGPDGKGIAGLHVFAYRRAEMTGTPQYFSEASGADGTFSLRLPAGRWYLLARKSFGGPAAQGEMYGKYMGRADHSVVLEPGQILEEVEIHVRPMQTP
ncbi:MAG: hypothetical protein D6740_01395 [Alphaproteobacteria bacterium]|nr:MAG: hypothetical protein D6740_01395 [Alphaproteobacteria bacterium]